LGLFVSQFGRRFYFLENGLAVSLVMKNLGLKLRSLRESHGQDLVEYALMAGFVAVTAGAIMPGVASSISTIFSQVGSVMAIASTQG
jgi:pilus assembly protein Flp/PilA